MADTATNDDEEYIREYGDNPSAPDTTPVNAADRAAPYDATQDFLNASAISGSPAGGTSPAVGQPGSTDITDQTNLNVASAMERSDLAGRIVQPPSPSIAATAADQFAQQRQQIEQQRTQLMAKLGMIPPSAAGLAAVVLPSSQRPRGGGTSDYEKAFEQLNYLNNESRNLLQEHHYSLIENAKQADEDYRHNKGITASTSYAGLMGRLAQIEADPALKVGTPQYSAAVLQARADFPEGANTKDGSAKLKSISDAHDKEVNFNKALYYHNFQNAFSEASQVARKYGTDVQYDAQGFPSVALTSKAGGGADTVPAPAKIPAKTMADYTALKVARAEKQSYLDKETYKPNIEKLKSEIAPIDTQIGAVEKQFPQLNPNLGATGGSPAEVTRTTQDGRSAVFDANTKKFLRYGR